MAAKQVPDEQFAAYHGYRCTLPDVRLFVERQPESWMAVAYELNLKRNVMEQAVHTSDHGKEHCQTWVNSFRGPHSQLGILTDMLDWEVY